MSTEMLLARREARKRKILENSAKRLMHITGRSNSVMSEFSQNSSDVNGHLIENKYFDFANVGEKPSYEENNEVITKIQKQNDCFDESYGSRILQISSTKTNFTEKPMSLIFLSTAVLFRITMEFCCHYIFANNAVISFVLATSLLISIQGFLVPETTFLGGFLFLSGISSQKVKVFTLLINILQSVIKNFAMYMFGFVLMDIAIKTVKCLY